MVALSLSVSVAPAPAGTLVCRGLEEADFADFSVLYGDPRVSLMCGLILPDQQALRHRFDLFRNLPVEQGKVFALYLAGDNRLVGVLQCFDWDARTGNLTMGYALLPTLWRRGLMQSCLKETLPWLFEGGLGAPLHRIQCWVLAENQRSSRLLLQLGFQLEGTLRQLVLLNGKYHDVQCLGLLQNELPDFLGKPGE